MIADADIVQIGIMQAICGNLVWCDLLYGRNDTWSVCWQRVLMTACWKLRDLVRVLLRTVCLLRVFVCLSDLWLCLYPFLNEGHFIEIYSFHSFCHFDMVGVQWRQASRFPPSMSMPFERLDVLLPFVRWTFAFDALTCYGRHLLVIWCPCPQVLTYAFIFSRIILFGEAGYILFQEMNQIGESEIPFIERYGGIYWSSSGEIYWSFSLSHHIAGWEA